MYSKNPIFLKTKPTICGLTFLDLAIIGVGLLLARTFLVNLAFSLGFIVLAIATHKLCSNYLDLTGILLGINRKKSLRWDFNIKENRKK